MSTTLRLGYLKLLKKVGNESLISTSVFGFPYRISLGDMFSESPFYNFTTNVGEILACAAWVLKKQKPLIFDIGAHCGYIATQLAQVLKSNNPVVYSFEPVAPTFADLVSSINSLGLQHSVNPVPIALSDHTGFVRLSYSKWTSMFAQVVPEGAESNQRAGEQLYLASCNTLDEVVKSLPVPDLIKIDVEGWEVPVFRGATSLLKSQGIQRTGICLEWNPEALRQAGFSKQQLSDLLAGYRYFYLNDYEGQRHKELEEITKVESIDHVCNLFVVKDVEEAIEQWKNNFQELKNKFGVKLF